MAPRWKKRLRKALWYLLLIAIGFTMAYPLLWLISGSFKSNTEIFSSLSLLPKNPIYGTYSAGWHANGKQTFATFFGNTFKMVIPTVLATIISSLLVAYGFARFHFRFKKTLFALMIAQLLMPAEVVVIPRFLLFSGLGWLNTTLPFIVPAAFATYSFFIFMLVQHIRSIPRELDESAVIDGCNSFRILVSIIVPLSVPALVSVLIFQFVWRWNDFLGPLIFISSVAKYPLSLALRMSLDVTDTVKWNQTLAMCVLSLIPPVLLFFSLQRFFVEGIKTTGMKG